MDESQADEQGVREAGAQLTLAGITSPTRGLEK